LAWDFDDIAVLRRHATNLMLPDLASHRGDGIAEGTV
jgi:hypothetical protein